MKKTKIYSFVKFQLMILTGEGITAGIYYSFGGLIVDTLVSLGWIQTNETPGLSFGTALAFGALFGMPAIALGIGILLILAELILYILFRILKLFIEFKTIKI